jgi:hypothetical protein
MVQRLTFLWSAMLNENTLNFVNCNGHHPWSVLRQCWTQQRKHFIGANSLQSSFNVPLFESPNNVWWMPHMCIGVPSVTWLPLQCDSLQIPVSTGLKAGFSRRRERHWKLYVVKSAPFEVFSSSLKNKEGKEIVSRGSYPIISISSRGRR